MPDRRKSDTVLVDKHKIVYVTVRGDCYHEKDCGFLNRSAEPISDLPKGKALDLGYARCGHCHP